AASSFEDDPEVPDPDAHRRANLPNRHGAVKASAWNRLRCARSSRRGGASLAARWPEARNARERERSLGPTWLARAGDGVRTRDIQLGKLSLYQLIYSRAVLSWIRQRTCRVKAAWPLVAPPAGPTLDESP